MSDIGMPLREIEIVPEPVEAPVPEPEPVEEPVPV